ncbi:hypothetical protein L798_03593 [Zootermopsis nevadensis]|uniref:Uncharacterized protein n=1 Tax=Zootermopsis nevadensis TaxID=136037 RepID=A0A067RBS4_ZOONE|nr:hypothetical protein L798_03593 [Zootermopsis nevadensis]
MVYADVYRLLLLVALLTVIPSVTLSAESDWGYSDHSIEDGTPHTKFRDKRTLDFILHGLAQMLGYRLQRNNAPTSTTPPNPPTSPPTQHLKSSGQPSPATPPQIVLVSLSDAVGLKREGTTTASVRQSGDIDKSHPDARHRTGSHNNDGSSDHHYKSDYSDVDDGFRHSGSKHAENDRDGNGDGRSRLYFGRGYSSGRGGSDRSKNGHNSDRSDHHHRSGHSNDKVNESLERIGHYIKGQFNTMKVNKNDRKEDEFKNDPAGKLEDHGRDREWSKEHVKSEYDKIKGFERAQDGRDVSEENRNGGHEGDVAQRKEKEDTSKSDDEEMFNEAHLKPPENTKQKDTLTHNIGQEDDEEETVEQEQDQKSTEESSEKEDVELEHAHNSKQESDEKDTADQKEDEVPKEEDDRKEKKHQEGDYHNQIPAPSLQTWDEDFWNSQYSFADSNPYSFGLLDSHRTPAGEQKGLPKIPDFSFIRSSTQQDNKESKPSHPEHFYNRPQYFDDPGFEPLHEWHVTSDRKSEKPSSGSSIHKETSEPQTEFKEEQQEISHDSSDSPEEPSDLSGTESPEPSKPPTHRLDITDNPPIPIHSTSKPKLAQLIHEMEGTKQNPLWPPPFDHAFESTDSSIATQHPKQTNVTLNKKSPGNTSPFLLNLYNYTSISDYLLDLSKKDLLQRQLSQHSPQHESGDHASLNYKSPVPYVAVVIPSQSKNEHVRIRDHSLPPEPSFVGIVYPQGLSSEDARQALTFTSTKSKSVKDNKAMKFTPFTKSLTSSPSQKVHHNDKDEIQDPPFETHYSSLYRGSSSALESTASSTTSVPNLENIQKYPDSYFSTFLYNPEIRSNSNTQLQNVNSYNNDHNYQENKLRIPSPFSSNGRQQESSTLKSLRLVVPDLQPYVSPHPQFSQLRVVIPDFPENESSFDYSSGSEQNESKNAPFEEHIGLLTIPPPTAYSDEPSGLKNPEKWVLGDDVANTENLKSKEYITRVSKVKVTGRVYSQPKTNLRTV